MGSKDDVFGRAAHAYQKHQEAAHATTDQLFADQKAQLEREGRKLASDLLHVPADAFDKVSVYFDAAEPNKTVVNMEIDGRTIAWVNDDGRRILKLSGQCEKGHPGYGPVSSFEDAGEIISKGIAPEDCEKCVSEAALMGRPLQRRKPRATATIQIPEEPKPPTLEELGKLLEKAEDSADTRIMSNQLLYHLVLAIQNLGRRIPG